MAENHEKLNKLLLDTSLFILDFSVVANVNSNEFDYLMQQLISNRTSVAVTGEFYENYDVVIHCLNSEQKEIAQKAYNFLESLSKNSLLFSLGDIYDNRAVKKMLSSKGICSAFYKTSELAETVVNTKDISVGIVVNGDGILCPCFGAQELYGEIHTPVDAGAAENGFFTIHNLPGENSVVYTADGRQVHIFNKIGNGGEGTVYDCDYENQYVAKIYHDGQLTALRIKKMLMMEKKQVRYDGLCWPEKVIYTSKKEPVGYLMKKVSGKSLSLVFDSYESVQEEFPFWTRQNLIRLAVEILKRIQYLHLFGILIGDLRMSNILVRKDGTPVLVDMDSCQIGNLPCPAGFGDFTPAELQNIQFNKTLRTYSNESFSCAVLIFKILFCGLHPYDQRNGRDSIEEEIVLKSFPYPMQTNGDFSRIVMGCYDRMWQITPYQFQNFLYEIFRLGKRPNISTMIKMLATYYDFINLYKDNTKNPDVNRISFEEE